jgi:ABC-type multidrug transport system fused ATPase/permease subunit
VIDRLPGRMSYELGERGASVSVGERQLLSFARAVAANPSVLVLDRGQIVEMGRHADLVRQGGLYASLWSRQSGGFLDVERRDEVRAEPPPFLDPMPAE